VLPAIPFPPGVPANPVGALRAHNQALGVRIDARTSMSSWDGDPLDLGHAISVLHPLATGELRRAATAAPAFDTMT
jgi:hypothetical protein